MLQHTVQSLDKICIKTCLQYTKMENDVPPVIHM